MLSNNEILSSAPAGAFFYCMYDYGDSLEECYLNSDNQFWDGEISEWVDISLIDDYFHSYRSIIDIKRISELEEWIKFLSVDWNNLIPEWVRRSAKSLIKLKE